MTTIYGSKIVTDGLILCLDAGNRKSLQMDTLINWNTWTAGTGSVTGYSCNGSASESVRSLQTDPFGNTNMVWGTEPLGDNNGDGGFNTSYYSIDNTKLYRHSVWVRRISDTTLGTCYMGIYTNGGGPLQISNGAANTNSYWDCRNIGSYTKNTWYLIVGHIYPHDTTATTAHPDTGIYTIAGGTTKVATCGCNIGGKDLKFKNTDTTMCNRCYHFYCTDTTSKIEFFQPRIDCCDGTEPTIADLLSGAGAKIFDLSGNGINGGFTNHPTYTSDNGGSIVFDGTDDYISLPNDIGYTTAFSVFAWFKEVGDPGGNYHIISGGAECEISIPIGGGLRTGLYTSDGRFVGNHGSGLVDGKYYYVGFTYNGAVKKSYINGEWVGDLNCTGVLTYSFSYRMIGQLGSSTTYHANGCIPYYHFYNRTLTEVEIKQNYNALKGRYGL